MRQHPSSQLRVRLGPLLQRVDGGDEHDPVMMSFKITLHDSERAKSLFLGHLAGEFVEQNSQRPLGGGLIDFRHLREKPVDIRHQPFRLSFADPFDSPDVRSRTTSSG